MGYSFEGADGALFFGIFGSTVRTSIYAGRGAFCASVPLVLRQDCRGGNGCLGVVPRQAIGGPAMIVLSQATPTRTGSYCLSAKLQVVSKVS
jgi:hypothetical protein